MARLVDAPAQWSRPRPMLGLPACLLRIRTASLVTAVSVSGKRVFSAGEFSAEIAS